MAREVIKIEGLRDLDEALVKLGEEFHPRNPRNVLRNALKDGGKLIADAGASLAPRDTGGLAESYQVSGKLSRRQSSQHSKESAIETFVGPTAHPKSIQTEFGNAHQSAQPHLRPAWDGNVRRVLDLIVDRAKERLEQTRKRLVRKAEREAAKMKSGQ